jgi:predicted TIM-barrel fold metal-dependent hydrolase
MDRYIVVSSDCHAGLRPELYRDYLDPEYRELYDHALPLQLAGAEQAEKNFLIKEINDEWRRGNELALTGAWDHAERIKMLDRDGIAAEVIFPDGITERNGPPFGVGLNPPLKDVVPEVQWAGARAHNRWLAEFCQMAPERRLGVAVVPLLWSVEESVKEVQWAVRNGLRSVEIPTLMGDCDPYHHNKYDPFWAACQDNGVIVNFHTGAAPYEHYFGKTWPQPDPNLIGGMGVNVSEVFFWTYRPLTHLIWGGVFERHPKLKVVFTEVGTGWMIPPYLRLMDHNYHDHQFSAKMGDYKAHLSMPPSEYYRRNVGIGASCISRADVEIRAQLGLEQIMWGSDYPHPEGTWPTTKKLMFDSFHDLPENEIAAMLGENAIRFFGFDRAKLAAIAERIGPKKSDFVTV